MENHSNWLHFFSDFGPKLCLNGLLIWTCCLKIPAKWWFCGHDLFKNGFSVVKLPLQKEFFFFVLLFIHRKILVYSQEEKISNNRFPNPASEHKFGAELCTKSQCKSKTEKKRTHSADTAFETQPKLLFNSFERRAAGVFHTLYISLPYLFGSLRSEPSFLVVM